MVMAPCGSIPCQLRWPSIPISRGESPRGSLHAPTSTSSATVLVRCGSNERRFTRRDAGTDVSDRLSMRAVRSLTLCSPRSTCEAFSHPDLDGVVCRRRPHVGASFARQPYELPYERIQVLIGLAGVLRIDSQRCRGIMKSPYLQWSVFLGSRPPAQAKGLAGGETIVPGSRGEVLAGDRPTLAVARCGRSLEGNPMRRKYSRKLAVN
jgi:hypothetical protein